VNVARGFGAGAGATTCAYVGITRLLVGREQPGTCQTRDRIGARPCVWRHPAGYTSPTNRRAGGITITVAVVLLRRRRGELITKAEGDVCGGRKLEKKRLKKCIIYYIFYKNKIK